MKKYDQNTLERFDGEFTRSDNEIKKWLGHGDLKSTMIQIASVGMSMKVMNWEDNGGKEIRDREMDN